MNRQKLATAICIILSVVFSVSFGLLIHFKVFLPQVSNTYERTLYYSEELYEEYQKEAEKMIANYEYTSKYPTKKDFYEKNGQTILVIKIGEYKDLNRYSDCLTATVKNYGTNEQTVTFERRRKSAEDAYKSAEIYRKVMCIYTIVFVFILIIFTVYLIKNSIKRCYGKVIAPILSILAFCAMMYFFYG